MAAAKPCHIARSAPNRGCTHVIELVVTGHGVKTELVDMSFVFVVCDTLI
jgi:hypothetical protein